MQRRSMPNDGNELDSVLSSSIGSLPNTYSKSSRSKSIAAAVADRAFHDETRSKFFPMMCLLLEALYSFVKGSSEVYSIFALGGYTTTLSQVEAIEHILTYRYLGALAVLPTGIVCDSYLGTFYPLMFFLCALCGFMGLHAVISLPSMLVASDAKARLAKTTFPIFALFYVIEPLKLVAIFRVIMENNYFRDPRHFYALLACSMNFGAGVGGTVMYFSLGSRYALCTDMFVNFSLTISYTAFFLTTRQVFVGATNKSDEFAVIEKALASIICGAFKFVDQHCFRLLTFKGSSNAEGDYGCFTLSQNTERNGRAIVGIVLVTVPLVAAMAMFLIVEALYLVQLSMFWYFPREPFPMHTLKSFFFLILFPLMEYCVGPALKKWSRSEASRLLTMVGCGCMCASLCLCWAFGVHKVLRDGNEFWYTFADGTGHVAITNCINEDLYIRSQFMSYIMDSDDGWTVLSPFKTLTILNVPFDNSPFHFEFTSTKLAMYDEYFLPIEVGKPTWYLILPTGVYPFPGFCFRRHPSKIAVSTSLYGPAKICVVCALTVCNGHVHFHAERDGRVFTKQVNLVPLTGRGSNQALSDENITLSLVGQFEISTILGGVLYTSSTLNATLERTSTYMLVAYEGPHTNWKKDEWVTADSVEPVDHTELVQNYFIKTSPRNTYHVEWMYPMVFFHALGQVTYQVSLWMFLFTQSTDSIRTTMFCFVDILCLPAHVYMYIKSPISLRKLEPMGYFYLSTVNCLFIILYFFCILFFIHKLFKVKPTHRGSVEASAQRRKSVAPLQPVISDERKGE